MSEYNMCTKQLFGRRCKILTGFDCKPFVYRIVSSGIRSNAWSEVPLTYYTERELVKHDTLEECVIVVCDTLINEESRLIRVALKDIELMDEAVTKINKVIQELDYCLEGLCDICSHKGTDAPGGCKDELMLDAMLALKAQEPQATTPEAEWLLYKGRRGATCSYCKHTYYDAYDVENCDNYCRHCGSKMIRIRTVKW